MDESPHRPSDLALYVMRGCGYCEDVRSAARELGVSLEECDTRELAAYGRELLAARGRATVPVLRITHANGADEWMGESQDIIRYLETRFGGGRRTSGRSWLRPWIGASLWVLLLAGGVSAEPARSVLWTAACVVAATRSASTAIRSGATIHGWIAAAFGLGAVSIALRALGVADLPWWYAALAVSVVALVSALVGRRPGREGRAELP